MAETRHTRVLIIGSGPAGYTAAVYSARAMLNPLLIQGLQPGGQLTITTEVENWPGDREVQGPELMVRMEDHARAMGAEIVSDYISSLDLSQRPFTAQADSGMTYTADAVILATGAQARWLGLPSEERFKGFGVSACATCDGFFYRGKGGRGGGRRQHRRRGGAVPDQLREQGDAGPPPRQPAGREDPAGPAVQASQDRGALEPPRSREVAGTEAPLGVTGIVARNVLTGETTEVPCEGFFVAIGHAPASELVKDQLELHHGGYVKVEPGTTRTSIPGVFAAGDLTDHVYRQAVTSAGMGCMAALDAERFLAGA